MITVRLGARLVMKNVEVKGGQLKLTGTLGGAAMFIWQKAIVELESCAFVENTAPGGAGIYNKGTLTMTKCLVKGNEAGTGAGINW